MFVLKSNRCCLMSHERGSPAYYSDLLPAYFSSQRQVSSRQRHSSKSFCYAKAGAILFHVRSRLIKFSLILRKKYNSPECREHFFTLTFLKS